MGSQPGSKLCQRQKGFQQAPVLWKLGWMARKGSSRVVRAPQQQRSALLSLAAPRGSPRHCLSPGFGSFSPPWPGCVFPSGSRSACRLGGVLSPPWGSELFPSLVSSANLRDVLFRRAVSHSFQPTPLGNIAFVSALKKLLSISAKPLIFL